MSVEAPLALYTAGRYFEAVAPFRALPEADLTPAARAAFGHCLALCGSTEEGLAHLNAAISAGDKECRDIQKEVRNKLCRIKTAKEWKDLGNKAFAANDHSLAECYYTAAITVAAEAKEASFFTNRCLVRIKLERLEEAKADAVAAKTIDPASKRPLQRLVQVCVALADADTAVEAAKELVALDDADEESRRILAEAECLAQSRGFVVKPLSTSFNIDAPETEMYQFTVDALELVQVLLRAHFGDLRAFTKKAPHAARSQLLEKCGFYEIAMAQRDDDPFKMMGFVPELKLDNLMTDGMSRFIGGLEVLSEAQSAKALLRDQAQNMALLIDMGYAPRVEVEGKFERVDCGSGRLVDISSKEHQEQHRELIEEAIMDEEHWITSVNFRFGAARTRFLLTFGALVMEQYISTYHPESPLCGKVRQAFGASQ